MGSMWMGYEYKNESKRIAAWTAHYAAKGCSSTKARSVACSKVGRSSTWPPAFRRNG